MASHRLYSAELTELENEAVFGKCANRNGHGHNYQVIVTVGGEVDHKTGMCFDLGTLDDVVKEVVVDRYDHRHLNLDVEDFLEAVPTGENIVLQIWRLLVGVLPEGKLHNLKLVETRDNTFEYSGGRT
ncbi:6-carboxytetrahydropterin synthase [Dehalococcoidia bacterium]|nr:6-carboxytetrahydropterin synthase [Dehalococcoidia bacterium]